MSYTAPTDEYRFIFEHVVPVRKQIESGQFEGLDLDDLDTFLETSGKLAEKEITPIQRSGDKEPAQLENGVVRTSPGFASAYQAVAEGGWIGMSATPDYGGLGLPISLRSAFTDSISGACMAFGLNPMLTQCQIDALEEHGNESIKSLYLPRLISGEWSGTMNITEPQAGSDVGAIRMRAELVDDGSYLLNGEKIYISWADADFIENICHLVLARLPDAPTGSKGLTLFLAPKFIPNDNGELGERNSIYLKSLERKLGIHGSPTAIVNYCNARAWMVGKPNTGLAAMFTMMNNARLGVGVQGVGVADAAWQQARDFALSRKQGQTAEGQENNIASHPNVRRSLIRMEAQIFAARSICALCAYAIDMSKKNKELEWEEYAAFLTPIAKAFGSDTAVEVSIAATQIHGGAGYIEDTGVAQFLRDSLVATIYEGTNDIQALDLIGRKLDSRIGFDKFMSEIEEGLHNPNCSEFRENLLNAQMTIQQTIDVLSEKKIQDRAAGAFPFLKAMALFIGGYCHSVGAKTDNRRYHLAKVYICRIMGGIYECCQEAKMGDEALFEIKY